ncbi:MAG: DoxX family protein [Sphingobacteriales bacterium]|nr:MAG: DoxX family protein [Sphingobacteriales bacterium]
MKKTKILYWVFTGLMAAAMIFSSVGMVVIQPESVALFKQIGFPEYMLPFIGWAKILGVLAILIPNNWRVKEWAYAGLTFDVLGAIYAFISIGLPASDWAAMFVFLFLIAASYYFHLRLQKQKQAENLNVNQSVI